MKGMIPGLILGAVALMTMGAATARADATIFDIQLGVYPENTVVEADGVVVTAVGFWGFYVQEPNPDPTWGRQYSGIWVFTASNHTVHKGDVVNVKATYQEYFGLSELDASLTGGFVNYVGPGTIPDPVPCLISEVNDTGAYAEAYEGVLIRVDRSDNTLYSYAPNSFNEWYLRTNNNATGDSLLIDSFSAKSGDDFEYAIPAPGTQISFVQGVLGYDHNQYKLAPRNCETDLGTPCKPSLRGAYATSTTTMNCQFSITVDEASSENVNNYELASGRTILTVSRDNNNHKIVHLTTEALGNGNPEQIIVSGVLGETGGLVMDPGQTADFRTGITPIYQIQFVSNPNSNDASPLVGQVVTVQGRVTAIDGSYYYLQDGDGYAWRGLYSRVARNGPIRERDEIQVTGQISEYYGATELNYKPGCDNFQNLGRSANPVTLNTVVASQIPYRGTKIAEPYEFCLVKLNNATMDSLPGVAGPYFGEWLLRQVTNPVFPDTAGCDLDGITPTSYDPCPLNRIDMTGILGYAFNAYRIFPRTGRGGDINEIYHAPGCPTTDVEPAPVAAGLRLEQNQPNPFTPETSIRFALPRSGRVNLEVLDVAGRMVRQLASGSLEAGEHVFVWDGTNDAGHRVSSGTYFYRLRSDGKELSRKMVRME
jgi:hypothetical protein